MVPGVNAAQEAGKLLEDLPALWEEADITERRRILTTILDAVFVDTGELKSIVAIVPKPAVRPLFEIALTRPESGVVLIKEEPPAEKGSEAATPGSWWRRGRVELHLNTYLTVLVAVGWARMASNLGNGRQRAPDVQLLKN